MVAALNIPAAMDVLVPLPGGPLPRMRTSRPACLAAMAAISPAQPEPMMTTSVANLFNTSISPWNGQALFLGAFPHLFYLLLGKVNWAPSRTPADGHLWVMVLRWV